MTEDATPPVHGLDPVGENGEIQEIRRVRSFEGIVDQVRRSIFSGRHPPGTGSRPNVTWRSSSG
jgi:hypothetical protein